MAREDGFFDDLARGLADGSLTRGKALRLMGAALVGGALASLPGAALADDCRRFGRRCRRDSQCCSRNCVRRGDDKVCGCPEGQRRCNDRCVNLDRNENHCGSCGNRCAPGEECDNGECGGGEPMCGPNPPCTEGFECVQELCRPICDPPCPESNCVCAASADGRGNVCIAAGSSPGQVDSCAECPPTGFPELTSCIDIAPSPDAVFLVCAPPCPQPT
jgi:hypothetical protein